MKQIAILLAAAAACGFASPAAAQVSSITYETTPCFGFCPVYRVTVHADGSGLFEGLHHTRLQGQRRFRITRAQFRAFVGRLAPARPARGDIAYDSSNDCQGAGAPPTDGPGVNVVWTERRRRQTLRYYSGCNYPQVRRALSEAPRLLPIARWTEAVREPGGRG